MFFNNTTTNIQMHDWICSTDHSLHLTYINYTAPLFSIKCEMKWNEMYGFKCFQVYRSTSILYLQKKFFEIW